jgi:hypothetical protein
MWQRLTIIKLLKGKLLYTSFKKKRTYWAVLTLTPPFLPYDLMACRITSFTTPLRSPTTPTPNPFTIYSPTPRCACTVRWITHTRSSHPQQTILCIHGYPGSHFLLLIRWDLLIIPASFLAPFFWSITLIHTPLHVLRLPTLFDDRGTVALQHRLYR